MTLTVETSVSVGEFLTQVAQKAGLKIEDSGPENVTLAFDMGGGRNQMPHGAWAIQNTTDGEYLVATDTQIAQTMDPKEFEASVRALAATADAKEQELGADSF